MRVWLLMIFLLAALAANARAASAACPPGARESRAYVRGTPEPKEAVQTATAEASPTPLQSTAVAPIVEIEKHIYFPYETLEKAVLEALAGIVDKALAGVQAELPGMVNKAIQIVLPEAGERAIFEASRLKLWRVAIVIAGILMPLTLVISVGSALKEGASSVTGYAGTREALVTWFVGVGAAIASYFLLSKAIQLSQLAGRAILEQIIVEADWNIGQNLVGALINLGRIHALPIVLKMFLGILAILLIMAITASLALALLAREVIILMLVGSAPIILILGALGPLRWLSWTWTKIGVITLLLGPANFLLIGGAFLIAQEANLAELLRDSLLGMLLALGFVSVLIGLNGLVGKMVYGSAIEVVQKAWQSSMAVVKMALGLAVAGAGIAAAPAIGSALGGTAAAGASMATTEAGGIAGAGLSQAGSAGNTFNTYSKAMTQANLTKSIGQALAATGNPIAKGFAAGLNIGASKTAFDQIHAGEATQGAPAMPPFSGDVDVNRAITNARNAIGERYPDLGSGEAGQLNKGAQLAQDTFKTFEKMGIEPKQALWELGYLRAGGNPQDAATQYAGQIIGGYARGREWGIASPSSIMAPGARVSAQDVNIACTIARSRGAEIDLSDLEKMASASHFRRTILQESTDAVLTSGMRASGGASIDSWLQDSYMELSMRAKSRNDEFRRAFGIGEE